MDDLNKERIRFNTEIIKLLVLLFITAGGGAMALLVEGFDSTLKTFIVVSGMMFGVTCGVSGLVVYRNTLKKLEK